MNPPFISIKDVVKTFLPNLPPAINNISSLVKKGSLIVMASPDGAGKTTLMRLIAGLLKPTSGSITIKGLDTLKDLEKINNITGYMPQKFGLYEDLNVLQNLNLYADLKGLEKEKIKERFKELLLFTGLESFKNRLAGDLSGGMKQKLGLACALIVKPLLLLLDEPSVGVDPISRKELWKMIEALLKEDITILWSTAYLEEAERADTLLLLEQGSLIYQGPPKELIKRVKGKTFLIEEVKSIEKTKLNLFLKEKNILDSIIKNNNLHIIFKELPDVPKEEKLYDIKLLKSDPTLEEAYIHIMGGNPHRFSLLAEKTPEITFKRSDMIQAEGLTKNFGNFTAANKISFTVPSGEIFGLLGPNGAGKSTTFKMLCGLLKPSSGKAYVNGFDLQQSSSLARSHIGYMAQKFSLYGNLSVHQNLKFFAGIYNLTGKKKHLMIDEMIDIFNLKNYLNENAEMLPLGFKQRLALSCSLMHRPRVLFLDEPTSGVDPITRREFWNHIRGLVDKGITVMVTTHFMDEAEYCDRIALVYKGHVINLGTPEDLKNKAKTKENIKPSLEEAFIKLIENYEGEPHD